MARRNHHHHHRRRRKRPRIHRHTPPGAAPGTLHAHPDTPPPVIRVMVYDEARLIERSIDEVKQIEALRNEPGTIWINVDGLGDPATIKQIGKMFGLHPLALEDVINVHQRAKVERYYEHLFIVTRRTIVTAAENLESEQISIFLGKDYVITFQQHVGDCFDSVRERLRIRESRVRQTGPDFLAYALIDAVIDSYFPIVERYADQLDEMEDQVAARHDPHVADRFHDVRNDLLLLRRSVRPHRDAISELIRDEHSLITDETLVFLRDCYDHTVQLIDLLEIYRETCLDLRDYYLSMVSLHTNDIMKVLTIIATIFIPLSFIAGVYGMNFDTELPGNMPELDLPYGYLGALGLMAAVAFALLGFFWRRGWIGGHR